MEFSVYTEQPLHVLFMFTLSWSVTFKLMSCLLCIDIVLLDLHFLDFKVQHQHVFCIFLSTFDQPRTSRREGYHICRYLYWIVSNKPTLLFQTVDASLFRLSITRMQLVLYSKSWNWWSSLSEDNVVASCWCKWRQTNEILAYNDVNIDTKMFKSDAVCRTKVETAHVWRHFLTSGKFSLDGLAAELYRRMKFVWIWGLFLQPWVTICAINLLDVP